MPDNAVYLIVSVVIIIGLGYNSLKQNGAAGESTAFSATWGKILLRFR